MYKVLDSIFDLVWAVVEVVLDVPPVKDEVEVRKFALNFLETCKRVATGLVPGNADDQAVDLCLALVKDDESWAAIYQFLLLRIDGRTPIPNGKLTRQVGVLGVACNWDIYELQVILELLIDAFLTIWRRLY